MVSSRFKQLKEEEARRRRQREEEKRKLEEASAKETQITNERENEAGVDLVENSENTIHSSSSEVAVNGNLPKHELKENQKTTSTFQMTDTEVSTSPAVDGRDKQQSHKDPGKVYLQV